MPLTARGPCLCLCIVHLSLARPCPRSRSPLPAPARTPKTLSVPARATPLRGPDLCQSFHHAAFASLFCSTRSQPASVPSVVHNFGSALAVLDASAAPAGSMDEATSSELSSLQTRFVQLVCQMGSASILFTETASSSDQSQLICRAITKYASSTLYAYLSSWDRWASFASARGIFSCAPPPVGLSRIGFCPLPAPLGWPSTRSVPFPGCHVWRACLCSPRHCSRPCAKRS